MVGNALQITDAVQNQIEHFAVIAIQLFPFQFYNIGAQCVLITVDLGLQQRDIRVRLLCIAADHVHRPEHTVSRKLRHLLGNLAALPCGDRRRFHETFVQKLQRFVLCLLLRHVLDQQIRQLFHLLAERQQQDRRCDIEDAVDDRNVRRINPVSQKVELHDRVADIKDT